ncbi:balbiani ring protein 3-like [Chrysoperla carnea]|uniref:balbiani ring protein 3-like n=1 Tax=Chrysoperla carnea TaxID=189513 RepID=UPI001D096AEA|nr:balbiani ring protein 3-like [Chrysoperla carnea]
MNKIHKYLIILSAISVYLSECEKIPKRKVACIDVESPEASKCRPRNTTVDILELLVNEKDRRTYPLISGAKMYTVILPRCSGNCDDQETSCMPVKHQITKVKKKIWIEESQKKFVVELVMHEGCECGCDIKAEDCNSNQVYNEDSCSCRCNKDKVKCTEYMTLDEGECKCICHMKPDACSYGTEFYPDICQCGKMMANGHMELMKNDYENEV